MRSSVRLPNPTQVILSARVQTFRVFLCCASTGVRRFPFVLRISQNQCREQTTESRSYERVRLPWEWRFPYAQERHYSFPRRPCFAPHYALWFGKYGGFE